MGRNKKEARNFRISSCDGFGIQLHMGRWAGGRGGDAVTNPGGGEEDGVRDGRSG